LGLDEAVDVGHLRMVSCVNFAKLRTGLRIDGM
jgi:hypothetical protein